MSQICLRHFAILPSVDGCVRKLLRCCLTGRKISRELALRFLRCKSSQFSLGLLLVVWDLSSQLFLLSGQMLTVMLPSHDDDGVFSLWDHEPQMDTCFYKLLWSWYSVTATENWLINRLVNGNVVIMWQIFPQLFHLVTSGYHYSILPWISLNLTSLDSINKCYCEYFIFLCECLISWRAMWSVLPHGATNDGISFFLKV